MMLIDRLCLTMRYAIELCIFQYVIMPLLMTMYWIQYVFYYVFGCCSRYPLNIEFEQRNIPLNKNEYLY